MTAQLTDLERCAVLTVAAEQLAPDDSSLGAACDAAAQACEDLRLAAFGEIFPSVLPPVSADLLATWRYYTDGGPGTYPDVHRLALYSLPALAGLLRGPMAVKDCRDVAEARATVDGSGETLAQAKRRAGDKAVNTYAQSIAQQLVDFTGHTLGDAARVYLSACELAARTETARARPAVARKALADRRSKLAGSLHWIGAYGRAGQGLSGMQVAGKSETIDGLIAQAATASPARLEEIERAVETVKGAIKAKGARP